MRSHLHEVPSILEEFMVFLSPVIVLGEKTRALKPDGR